MAALKIRIEKYTQLREDIVGMLPGGDAALKDADLDKGQAELRRMEALICAMTPKERRQAFEDGYIQGFRLPGNGPSAQPTPAPTAQPQQPTSRSEQPAPNPSPLPPPATGAPGVAPVIGLGLGAFLLVLLFVGVITLVNRARDDEF